MAETVTLTKEDLMDGLAELEDQLKEVTDRLGATRAVLAKVAIPEVVVDPAELKRDYPLGKIIYGIIGC